MFISLQSQPETSPKKLLLFFYILFPLPFDDLNYSWNNCARKYPWPTERRTDEFCSSLALGFATLSMDQKGFLPIHDDSAAHKFYKNPWTRVFFLLLQKIVFLFCKVRRNCFAQKINLTGKSISFESSSLPPFEKIPSTEIKSRKISFNCCHFCFDFFYIKTFFLLISWHEFKSRNFHKKSLAAKNKSSNLFSFFLFFCYIEYFLSIDFASSLDDSPFTSNALMDEATLTHRPSDIKKNIVCSPYINV